MTVILKLVRETELARLFQRGDGSEIWIPRSICKRTTKFPVEPGRLQECEIEVEEWFANKNNL